MPRYEFLVREIDLTILLEQLAMLAFQAAATRIHGTLHICREV